MPNLSAAVAPFIVDAASENGHGDLSTAGNDSVFFVWLKNCSIHDSRPSDRIYKSALFSLDFGNIIRTYLLLHSPTTYLNTKIPACSLHIPNKMAEKVNDIQEHLKDLLAVSKSHDDMPTEEIASLIEKLEGSKYWAQYTMVQERIHTEPLETAPPQELSPDEVQEYIRNTLQSDDDEKRQKQGLEPRAWSEVEKEFEELAQEWERIVERTEAEAREFDAERRKAEGLEPRSEEDFDAEMGEGLERICNMMAMVMKLQEEKLEEKGLDSNRGFWEPFSVEFNEAVEGLRKGGGDGVSALRTLVSLCERADERLRQQSSLME